MDDGLGSAGKKAKGKGKKGKVIDLNAAQLTMPTVTHSPGVFNLDGSGPVGSLEPSLSLDESLQQLLQQSQTQIGKGRDAQPALVIGRHYISERDSAPVQYNGIV